MNPKELCRLCTKFKNFETTKENDLFEPPNLIMLQQIKDLTGISVKDGKKLPRHFCDDCRTELSHCYQFRQQLLQSKKYFRSQEFKNLWLIKRGNSVKTKHKNKFHSVFITVDKDVIQPPKVEPIEENEIVIKNQTENKIIETVLIDAGASNVPSDLKLESCPNQEYTSTESCPIKLEPETAIFSAIDVNLNASLETMTENSCPSEDRILNANMDNEDELYRNSSEASESEDENNENSNDSDSDKSDTSTSKRKNVNVNAIDKSKKFYKCNQCEKSFRYRQCLDTHLLHHRENPYFECEVCAAKFVSSAKYNRHMLLHNEFRYPCHFCERKFRSGSARVRHERSNHTHDRPFLCAICGKTFTVSYILSNHMLVHTKKRAFKCELCNKFFLRKEHLKTHYKSTAHRQNEGK